MPRLCVIALALFACITVATAQDPLIAPNVCGNGIVEPGEECDPGFAPANIPPDLGGATCGGQGFTGGGDVSCTSSCMLDISACNCNLVTSFPATGQTLCWNRQGQLIDCAGTGHDGDMRAGAALTYTDNGDGTITDENTGLMWERKNDAGGIHDKDKRHRWDRTFTDFIDKLNNTCEGDGFVVCDSDDICGAGGQCGFAGYRDWRMPNMKELVSIVDLDRVGPSVHPAFNTGCVGGCTECSCTVSSHYWSSSSYAYDPDIAWYVYFYNGYVLGSAKNNNFYGCYVRGVRGGS